MYTKKCKYCKSQFTTRDHRQVFCNSSCSSKYFGVQRFNKLVHHYICEVCDNKFMTKYKIRNNRKIRCSNCKRIVPKTINFTSILELSRRTVSKIVQRLRLSCFNCGWNKTVSDIHHIIPKSLGGTDAHYNLTYLCPNCHRLAHANKIKHFITIQEKVTLQDIKSVYNCSPIK